VTPRPAAGKLTTSSPPVLVQIAKQQPPAASAACTVRAKEHSRSDMAELRKQANAVAVIVYRREKKSRPGGRLLLSSMLSSYSVCWQMA